MFNMIPRKKVSVSDIKQYLVDEFKNTNELQHQVYQLQDQIKKCAETELKYESTLVTLDEFRNRLNQKEDRIKKLDDEIKEYEKEIKSLNNTINDKELNYKKLDKMYDELKNYAEKEIQKRVEKEILNYKDSLEKKINNLKGNISKKNYIIYNKGM